MSEPKRGDSRKSKTIAEWATKNASIVSGDEHPKFDTSEPALDALFRARGGKRPNSGPKKKAVVMITRSLAMLPASWAAFDELRGTEARGAYMARVMGL